MMSTKAGPQKRARRGRNSLNTSDATPARLAGIVALLLTVLTINMTNAQAATKRKWAIDFRPETGTLHMMLGVEGGSEHGRNEKYFKVSLEELSGLTREQVTSANSEVEFRLTRDAGTFNCKGRFRRGNGSGIFTFDANPDFAARLGAQGFGQLSEESQLLAAIYDIDKGTQKADANEPGPQVHVNVHTPGARAGADFIGELEALGYERPSAHQLSAMSTQGVTLDFIRELNPYFSTRPTLDQLIGIRTQGISADYVKGLASLGYKGLSAKQIICLRVRGISLDYIQGVQAETSGRPSLRKLIQMRDPDGTSAGDCGPEAFPDE